MRKLTAEQFVRYAEQQIATACSILALHRRVDATYCSCNREWPCPIAVNCERTRAHFQTRLASLEPWSVPTVARSRCPSPDGLGEGNESGQPWLDVALWISPLIRDVVPAHTDQVLVVRDMVDGWTGGDLESCVGEYVERIDRSAFGGRDPYRLSGATADAMTARAWRNHLTSLQSVSGRTLTTEVECVQR